MAIIDLKEEMLKKVIDGIALDRDYDLLMARADVNEELLKNVKHADFIENEGTLRVVKKQ